MYITVNFWFNYKQPHSTLLIVIFFEKIQNGLNIDSYLVHWRQNVKVVSNIYRVGKYGNCSTGVNIKHFSSLFSWQQC